jgi:hypothetical protein
VSSAFFQEQFLRYWFHVLAFTMALLNVESLSILASPFGGEIAREIPGLSPTKG